MLSVNTANGQSPDISAAWLICLLYNRWYYFTTQRRDDIRYYIIYYLKKEKIIFSSHAKYDFITRTLYILITEK